MAKIVKPEAPDIGSEYVKYTFNWKRIGSKDWEKMEVIGHRYYEENNRMVLFKESGGIFEIPKWKDECYSDLGEDWAKKISEVELATQEKEEQNESTRPN